MARFRLRMSFVVLSIAAACSNTAGSSNHGATGGSTAAGGARATGGQNGAVATGGNQFGSGATGGAAGAIPEGSGGSSTGNDGSTAGKMSDAGASGGRVDGVDAPATGDAIGSSTGGTATGGATGGGGFAGTSGTGASGSTGGSSGVGGGSGSGASGSTGGSSGAGGGSGSGGSTGTHLLGSYKVVAWNDLGMHCMDGKDYSVFSILPPYNNLHAQVIRTDVTSGKLVDSSAPVTLTYEAVTDAGNSINTISSTKTNFWTWVAKLFGANPAPDHGLNLNTPTVSNPTPSHTPAPMTYDSGNKLWIAEGIPITPYPDDFATNGGVKNFYPMVKVVVRDTANSVLATTSVVLPVSDEMSCKSCHASSSGYTYARPAAGWVNDTTDVERDWKKNVLRLHDETFPDAIAVAGMSATYTGGTLLATVEAGQPILCAGCHQSNALGTSLKAGIKPLTEALHGKHATVYQPGTTTTLDALTTRDGCYNCHPGSTTKCLRGAMGKAVDPNTGLPSMDCQSCHGSMSTVGKTGRAGWLDEPSCQNCHDRASGTSTPFVRYTSVFSSGTSVRTTVDTRFATNPNTPAAGKSLYRFSTGHGGLQCEACHGSTHAEYPTVQANDNAQSLALQGHVGTVGECTVCHSTTPTTSSGGPHGMHEVGQAWVQDHHSGNVSRTACQQCHGTTSAGSPLAVVKTAKTLNAGDYGTKTFAAGDRVSCWSCHSGPNP
jgi:hypothetical protein